MSLLSTYRRIDLLQRGMRFRVAVTVLVLLGCGAGFGTLLAVSYRLDGERTALREVLAGQNRLRGDEHALGLVQSGTVTVGGVTYGGERFRANADLLFDADGGLRAPEALTEQLLQERRPAWAPRWLLEQPATTWMLALLVTGWLLLIVWMSITVPFLLTLLGTAIPVGVAWLLDAGPAMLAFAGIGLLTFTYIVLTRLLLIAYRPSRQVLAVAHTVIKEASRNRISLVFIVLLLVVLPLLPLWLDPASPLRYQIQTFISRSMGVTFMLTACMTLFLSCATVAFEIRDRQIWQLMTKPVGRLNYLLGKWLGVVSVNLILLAVSGVSIFTFVQYLREQPVARGLQGQLDALAVDTEVLTARRGRRPDYDTLDGEQLTARVEQYVERSPELPAMDEIPLSTLREIRDGIRQGYQVGQRSVPPRAGRDYTFSGLAAARRLGEPLTLRYKFYILKNDEHEVFPAVFVFNRDPEIAVRRTYVPTMTHVLPVPAQLIQPDGTLTVTILNGYEPPPDRRGFGAINFELPDFEILYKVGSFEANFLRAVLINWVKLAFLAMLAVCASTFLSFPVACLLSFTVFIAGMLGPYLADALGLWYPPATSQMDWQNVALVIQWAFQWFIKGVAETLVWSLSAFGEISATQRLVEGRFISWGEVLYGFLKLGVLWSGIALAVGYAVMRSRQLAIYSGHG